MEVALGGRQGAPAHVSAQGGRRVRGASGRTELQQAARRALAMVAPAAGGPGGGARLHRQRVARDGEAGAKKNALKPWRRIGWVIPPQSNADFAAAMEQVLDVYRRPYDPAFPVVCMDETPRQFIGETRLPIAGAPGRPAREDYEYRRCGTCNVFMASEPLAGTRMTRVMERRTKDRLGALPRRHRRAVYRRNEDHSRDGQPEHSSPRRPLRDLPGGPGQGAVGPLRVRLHPPSTAVGSTSPRSNSAS